MERVVVVSNVLPQDGASRRRSGFTLVELLAVIMIIALLAALVTPAVMRSLSSARAAVVKNEIEVLSTALMNYKSEYGSFPPSDMHGLWDATASPPQVNRTHAVYRHLKRCFPRLSEVEQNNAPSSGNLSPYFLMAQMSPAQALVFWLQGFFDNQRFPLTNGDSLSAASPRVGTLKANRNKFFDFNEVRLYAAPAYWPVKSPFQPAYQTFTPRNATTDAFARDYPVYFPDQANTGLPFVYFSSTDYSQNSTGVSVGALIGPTTSSPDIYYMATSLGGNKTEVAPYFSSTTCGMWTMYSYAQLHMSADTFQLIAAGADGTYGNAVASFPGEVSVTGFPHGPFKAPKDNPGHEDNISNFATGRLKEAAEKLSQ